MQINMIASPKKLLFYLTPHYSFNGRHNYNVYGSIEAHVFANLGLYQGENNLKLFFLKYVYNRPWGPFFFSDISNLLVKYNSRFIFEQSSYYK